MKKWLLFSALIICFGLFSNLFSQATPKNWKGNIRKEQDILVITNPSNPLLGEFVLDLEEDLAIGDNNNDNSYFYGAIRFAIDSHGNVYVLDVNQKNVRKFNSKGKFIHSFGREGQGPGEFDFPSSIVLDNLDRVYILDDRRIEVYNCEGKYLSSIKSSTFLAHIVPFHLETFMAITSTYDEKGWWQEVALLERERGITQIFGEKTKADYAVRRGTSLTNLGPHAFSNKNCIIPVNSGLAAFAHSSKYRINILDQKGTVIKVILVDEKPEAITRADKNKTIGKIIDRDRKSKHSLNLSRDEVMKVCDFADFKPFFRDILSDGIGNLFIMRTLEAGDIYTFDLFNAEGIFLSRFHSPVLPLVIHGECLYSTRTDEEGIVRLIRYQIKNWNSLITSQ